MSATVQRVQHARKQAIEEYLAKVKIPAEFVQEYAGTLIELGFDSIDSLVHLRESDLSSLEIGHRRMILSGIIATKSTPPVSPSASVEIPEQLVFFSYATSDAVSEVGLLAKATRAKFPGKAVFRDADSSYNLSELVNYVKHSKNVVVVLTGNYARRPFALVELVTSLRCGANVVAVLLIRPGMNSFSFEQVQADIKSKEIQNYLDERGWAFLQEYDISVEDVCKALLHVMNVKAEKIDMDSRQEVLDVMIDCAIRLIKE